LTHFPIWSETSLTLNFLEDFLNLKQATYKAGSIVPKKLGKTLSGRIRGRETFAEDKLCETAL